ncbi:hypothetical protein TEA_016845 [Camellia sinensis var. sinensis]|uniref:Knl1 C-terminal RWD domain-containing protein n=1 Tax=Camellia sinensis var. sinensis TaxID=542762 RepID=A0A4S4D0R2_CAMSN|nr:hypothetical protein TEA_016845 [Camellia sinensis var. sinensis]
MDSKVDEDHCNTETEEGSNAHQKKRSRRVSFAEMTSVRFFDRDDEFDTSSDPKPNSESAQSNEGLADGHNEEEEEDDDDELDAARSFLRPMESPSPGSTFGSATSNDEDNFFGPVSASFIRPGRLSDSAASDENHDITMDSTAFSMHFRSLARSDSGGDLKTPTGVHLYFEEKTPTQNIVSTDLGSSMVLTVAKEPISISSTFVDKLSGDMSLVEENPHKYDYGRLSPGLDALLAEGSKDLHTVSVSDNITISKSPINMKSRLLPSKTHGGPVEPIDSIYKEMDPIDTHDTLAEAVPFDVSIDKKNWSPNELTKGLLSGKSKESDAVEIRRPNLDFDAVNCGTPSNLDNRVSLLNVSALRECESPLAGSMSSLCAKQRQIVLGSASPSKSLQITTPSPKQPGSFARDEIRKHGESVSSIQKSMSKLKMLEASPFSSTLKLNIDSTLISSEYLSKTTRYNTVLDRNIEDAQTKCVDASVACEDQYDDMQKVAELFTQSPLRKEISNATHNDRLHSFVVENVLSAPKRKREDVIPRGSDFLDEITRNQRSPKLHKSESCDSEFLSNHRNECNTETSTVGCKARLVDWADVFSNFKADTKQLISPSIDKLNLKAIGVLEDVLENLRRLQMYEMLCTEIHSQVCSLTRHKLGASASCLPANTNYVDFMNCLPQKSFENLSNFKNKRVAEMRLLLHRFVHEQAKLQFMSVKRERLMKKVQLLSSVIQESQMLKLNSLPRLSVPCAKDAQVDHSHCQSVNFDGTQEEEVVGDKVTALRLVLEASERKVISLTKSFHTSCKMKGEPSCGDTMLLVNDHLKKKACCRFIRLDLQSWEVANLESTGGHHNIVLNYLGFIIQCFTINVGSVSSIVISNKLNDANILKSFPNMDVCTAFAFAFNANTTQNYVGSRSFTQETQITSSVLGNLLDVVEEVQVARVELQNLTYSSFHSPSVEQLELHLHFIDFSSSRKVALILDMSCLKWGIYPSEIIPSQLESPSNVSQKSLPEPLSAEIIAAIQSIRVGYARIISLCRLVLFTGVYRIRSSLLLSCREVFNLFEEVGKSVEISK